MLGNTIDKSKAKKKQTIIGTDEGDNIKGSKYADKIYSGKGYDIIYPGKGADTIIINGVGDKYIHISPGTGNKTLKFTDVKNDDGTTICLEEGLAPFEYIKSGNDLIIKMLYEKITKKGFKYAYQNLTIKDYFNNSLISANIWIEEEDSSPETLYGLLGEQGITIKGDKKRNFTGSEYDDYIIGTKKADTITTGGHHDTITPGKGNDTITLDKWGIKNIEINNGDGYDTIILDDKISGIYEANLYLNPLDVFETEKSLNDLILYRYYDSGKSVKTEKTILKNYDTITNEMFKATVNKNNISSYRTLTKPKLNLKKTSTVEVYDSKLTVNNESTEGDDFYKNNMIVTGSKKDVIKSYAFNSNIFSGAGNDKITISAGNAFITGGNGNDTITGATDGKLTINYKKGDGNDTVILNAKPSEVVINIESGLVPKIPGLSEVEFYNQYFNKIYSNIYAGKLGFKKSGNDLVFSIPSGKKAQTITVKDYFAGVNYMPDIDKFTVSRDYFGEESTDTLYEAIRDMGIWADGRYSEAQKATVFDAVGNWRNIYKFSGKGKAVFNGANEDDIYMTTLNKKTEICINNTHTDDSDQDQLMINANYKNVKALFNVGTNGLVKVTENSYSNDLIIFNKKSLTAGNVKNLLFNDDKSAKGVIALNNFWNEYGNAGTGYMETVTVSANIVKNLSNLYNGGYKNLYTIETNEWVNEVATEVAQWLNSGGRTYTDAFYVLEHGTDKEVSALLKIYQGVTNCAEKGVLD